jgi:predicted double-glycine peptidase
MRVVALCCAGLVAAQAISLHAQEQRPLQLLDVPFISQSELLCGGAAAAMVLRYWGERAITAESFAALVDRSAAGIRTDTLVADLARRGWTATAIAGSPQTMRGELNRGRPVLTLIEDRPATFHYIVVVAAHERGVVFHDPARAPFLVMSAAEFDRRWRAADRWMAVVVPGAGTAKSRAHLETPPREIEPQPSIITACDQVVAEGVRLAQANDLAGAERTLSAAVGCPAAMRELAGVRVLQKRWPEAADLASAAVEADETDTYAWQVLGTSRFVQNDRLGALAAWNHAGEPRLDLVRFDGLTRTRHRAVEQLVGAVPGSVLSAGDFIRARRRLAELPSASSTRLEYTPVGAGVAELRGAVAERRMIPAGRLALAAMALSTAATRDVRVITGSLAGGGERVELAWRFWPRRPRVAVRVEAPAPWGGVWSAQASSERQPFNAPDIARAEQTGGRLGVSNWVAARWRWSLAAGVDEWSATGARGAAGAALQFVSLDERIDGRAETGLWSGRTSYATTRAFLRARSSRELQGSVLIASAGFETASRSTPMNLWPAGDTGHVRAALLRAHPVLDEGRLRVERLGRAFLQGSLEAQRWWRVAGPLRVAAAAFTDMGRTARRAAGSAQGDADAGLGVRVAVAGIPGIFRADLGRGLRDGATALSVVYEP